MKAALIIIGSTSHVRAAYPARPLTPSFGACAVAIPGGNAGNTIAGSSTKLYMQLVPHADAARLTLCIFSRI